MEKWIIFGLLAVLLGMFIWGRLRYDLTAIFGLLLLTVLGIVPSEEAFNGFAHPAVITVAAILVVSKALEDSGLIDYLSKWMLKVGNYLPLQVFVLCTIVCFASAFMNNVGALAILMPVAIQVAKSAKFSVSYILMPLAFSSLVGGMITLIGTPPNIIISSYRNENFGEGFSMFEYAPIGLSLAVVGLAFIALVGWRLIPARVSNKMSKDRFMIEDYTTEVVIQEDSTVNGARVGTLRKWMKDKVLFQGFIRDERLIHAPGQEEELKQGDILIIQADSNDLKDFIENTKTRIAGKKKLREEATTSDELVTMEVVIAAFSEIINRTAADVRMRSKYGVNLLAIAREDQKLKRRIIHTKFKSGDVLLVQAHKNNIQDAIKELGCLPIADRGYSINKPRPVLTALFIFITSIALVISGLLEVHISFMLAAFLMVVLNILPIRKLYTSIDWPVIVLLGAMLPIGTALEETGGASMIADGIVDLSENVVGWVVLSVLMLVTMLLSAVINNAATVVLMAPIAISIATGLNFSTDAFLMAVAVGGSCAFLTPIAHQSNTLVMGPGGYKFSDYFRLGLPLSILTIVVSVPIILWIWG